MASGRIEKSANVKAELRKNLRQHLRKFRDLTSGIEEAPTDLSWYVGKVRFDLEISATGRVKFGSVGGDVKIRLEWFHVQKKSTVLVPRANPQNQNQNQSLRELAQAISEDLTAAGTRSSVPTFKTTYVYLALGMTASGNVGVAKGSASAVGTIYFMPAEKPARQRLFAPQAKMSQASWYIIDSDSRSLRYAKNQGIETVSAMGLTGDNTTLFKANRQVFREGLRKAMRISDFFADRAAQAQDSEWEIFKLRPTFALSVSGGLSLVTLTGTATVQIELQNRNF
jgi:hypothetical protein